VQQNPPVAHFFGLGETRALTEVRIRSAIGEETVIDDPLEAGVTYLVSRK